VITERWTQKRREKHIEGAQTARIKLETFSEIGLKSKKREKSKGAILKGRI